MLAAVFRTLPFFYLLTVYLLYLMILLVPVDAMAARTIVISRSATLDFMPERITCIVAYDNGEPFKVSGFSLRPPERGLFSPDEPQYFGARLSIPANVRTIESAFILFSKTERFAFLSPETKPVSELTSIGSSVEELKIRLQERQEQLKSWKMQAKVQGESLERLRSDAEVIGNLGRLTIGVEERDRTLAAITNIKGDIDNLRHFLKLANSAPVPSNFKRRENILTKQLAELANSATMAEKEERQRKSHSEGKLRRELALIEDTRTDNIDQLRRDLEQLRSRRKALEQRYGIQAGGSQASSAPSANDDYELPKSTSDQ